MASQKMMKLLLTNNPIRLAVSNSLTPAVRKYATRTFRNPVLKKQTEEAQFLRQNPIKPLPVIVVLVYLAFVPYPIYCVVQTMITPEEE